MSNDSSGKLLVWGCGEFGQHGHGHQNDIALSTGFTSPLLLGQHVFVAKVACGSSHTVCITDDNRIYSWGNGNSGQLGTGQSKTVFQPHSVQLGVSLGTRVDGVSCGTRHTFVWTDNGECYSFGNNFSAQLGYDFRKPDFKDNQPSPVYLETLFNQKVVQVACGSRHSLFLFNSGRIASVGSNDRGQLGLGSRVESVIVKTLPDMEDIAVIGSGNCHCLAADGNGQLYAWGYGKACGSKEDILEPSCIYSFNDKLVKSLEGGDSHSILLLNDGYLYSWGVNFEGQLGLGEQIKFQSIPAEIKDKALQGNVLSISVGENTSAATTENGELLMWGRNVNQVFRDDEGPRYCQFYPFCLSLGNWKAVKVSCGSWHVACLVVPSKEQIPTRKLSFASTTKSDLSELLYKSESQTLPGDYLDLLDVNSNLLLHEEAIDNYKDCENDEFLEDNKSEVRHYSNNSMEKITDVLSSARGENDDKELTCNEKRLDLKNSANIDVKFESKEVSKPKTFDGNYELKEPISNMQKLFIQDSNEKPNLNEQKNMESKHCEAQKPCSAPGSVITRNKEIKFLDGDTRGPNQLRRTQSEDSSVCKSILDLVSTKNMNSLHYSRSFSDFTIDRQNNIRKQGSANKLLQGQNPDNSSVTDNVKRCEDGEDYKLKFIRRTSEPTVAEGEKNIISGGSNGGVNIYTAKQTEVYAGNVKTTQFKLTGNATGHLNRQKQTPRHLRRAPSTPEYTLPNQPINSMFTSQDKQLQRTQSNPNINISGQKLDVKPPSSTPSSPPSRSHVPHPPIKSIGSLPPRPPGTRKPKSQKILYSSGSSWRRRTTMM